MPKSVISTTGTYIVPTVFLVKSTQDGSDNTRLTIEFTLPTEPEHPPYSAFEQANKREFRTDFNVTSNNYKVLASMDGSYGTKFIVEARFTSKIPGTGSEDLIKLEE